MVFLPLLMCSLLFTTCEKEKNYNRNETPLQDNYQLGLIATPPSVYSNIPSAPAPAPSGNLPSSFFLEIPSTPFDQGTLLGSCASCASSTAKSVLDHEKYYTPFPNNGITYSPSFLYNQSKVDPNDCKSGSYVYTNLDILKNQGICNLSEMPYSLSSCSTLPTNAQKNLAASHKIDHYFKIDPISILWIKEFIHAGLPVIIAFQVDDFFKTARANSIWKQFGLVSKGNHCTILYGYDDSKNAFKMLNSWGTVWGNNGTIWVDYNFVQNGSSLFYGKIFYEAYIIQNPAVTNKPTADFDVIGGNTTITAGSSISFVDQSSNNPTSWSWSFPGGTPSASTLKNPTLTYSAPGNYSVSLTVSNQSGSDAKTLTNYIQVNQAVQTPVAQFSASGNTTITSGSSVSFVDQSLNNPTSWLWNFPGGTPGTSTSKNPTIIYANPGTYNVSLTVSNQSGSDSKTLQTYILVNQSVQIPVAQFTASSSTTITAGSSVSFVDQSSNNPTSWSWSFPGGTPSTSTLKNPTVTYNNSNTYNVSLTATNQAGSSSITKPGYITVTSNQTWTCGQPFTDSRDGNTYATVSIGGQCWMAEDLRYVSSKSVASNGQRYYDYSDAINIAPKGWHLPLDSEWQMLEVFLGMNPSEANSDGWRGTDQGYKVRAGGSSGLNLNLNGLAYSDNNNIIVFSGYMRAGNYWTSSKYYNSNPAVNAYITIGRSVSTLVPSQIYRFNSDVIDNFYSVRFIKD